MPIFEKNVTQEQFFAFSSVSKQMLLKEIALGHSLLDGRGLSHQYTALQILLSRIGDASLREKWKDNFDKNMKIIKDLSPHIAAIQVYLAKMNHKKIQDTNISDPAFGLFCKHIMKIYENIDIFMDAYFTLLLNPQVNSLAIPNGYWVSFDSQYSLSTIIRPQKDSQNINNMEQ